MVFRAKWHFRQYFAIRIFVRHSRAVRPDAADAPRWLDTFAAR